jgi:DNA-directed RNA polymerase subunit M/transcription elongation factor TFIIS
LKNKVQSDLCPECKNTFYFTIEKGGCLDLECPHCGIELSIEDKIAISHQYSIAFSLSQEQQFQKKMAQAKFTSPSKYIKKLVLEELNHE